MNMLMFAIGVLIGCVLTAIIFWIKSVGSLRIDTSDPDDEPYLFLELSKSIDVVCRKRHIMLKVNTKSFVPHE
jgi:hypothetical protein